MLKFIWNRVKSWYKKTFWRKYWKRERIVPTTSKEYNKTMQRITEEGCEDDLNKAWVKMTAALWPEEFARAFPFHIDDCKYCKGIKTMFPTTNVLATEPMVRCPECGKFFVRIKKDD